MDNLLETLKNLTPEQCIEIGKIFDPAYVWEYFVPYPEQKWNGHDIVTNQTVNTIPRFTIQIDYREATEEPIRVYNHGVAQIRFPQLKLLEVYEYLKKISSKETIQPIENKGEISDGYHTFNELYAFRLQYNAAFFNQLAYYNDYRNYQVHKSKKHSDGTPCFDGTYFIVLANLPTGQISNHYKMEYWDYFKIPEAPQALFEYDGHTSQDVLRSMAEFNRENLRVSDVATEKTLILKRLDLSSESKNLPFWAITYSHFRSEFVKKMMDKDIVLFIDDDGQTSIIKNKYGNLTNTIEPPKEVNPYEDKLFKYYSIMQELFSDINELKERYNFVGLTRKLDENEIQDFQVVKEKSVLLEELKQYFISIFSKE